MDRHTPTTTIDKEVNTIVDLMDAGNWEEVRRRIEKLPYGLTTLDVVKAALEPVLARSVPVAMQQAIDHLDVG
jgi:hypothetical protein